MSKKLGKIHGKGFMTLHMDCGTAKTDEYKLDLSTNASNGSPMVRNSVTNKWFTLNWQEIIDLAIEAGIDKPSNKNE